MKPVVAPLAVFIMGVSGSGKSTIGRSISASLACPYLEGDDFHSIDNVAKMSDGVALTDTDRWPWLDRLGTALGDAACGSGMAIAACSALRRAYRDRLRSATGCSTVFVLLRASEEELERRLIQRTSHYMPPSLLASQLALLEVPTADEMARTFDTALPRDETLSAILNWLHLAALDVGHVVTRIGIFHDPPPATVNHRSRRP